MNSVYLDWASTSPEDPEVGAVIQKTAQEAFGNPSSPHSFGKTAYRILDESRETIASLLSCSKQNIIFTGGGSEANNIIFSSLLLKRNKGSVVISGIEHPSVYEPAMLLKKLGFEVIIVPAERSGHVSADAIGNALRDDTILVSVMLVNNETGAIQPIAEITAAVRSHAKRRPHIHTDCVQAFGKIPIDVRALGIDSLSVSAHKVQGPKGVGVLCCMKAIEPLYRGGGQEAGFRPGTENVPAIAGFAYAASKRYRLMKDQYAHVSLLKATLIEQIKCIPGAVLIPDTSGMVESYSPYILALAFPPIPGEVLVRVLNDEGFAVSTGAACSSKKAGKGRVLEGMGVPKDTRDSAIRVSFGFDTRIEDIESFSHALERSVRQLMPRFPGTPH